MFRLNKDALSIIDFHLLQLAAMENANDINKAVTRSKDCNEAVGVPHNLFPGPEAS